MAAKDAPKTGEVLFCGMTDWKNVGRKAKPGTAGDPSTFPNIFVPTRVGGLSGRGGRDPGRLVHRSLIRSQIPFSDPKFPGFKDL